MTKHWEEMTADEKAVFLRDEIYIIKRGLSVLSVKADEVGNAVKAIEQKLQNLTN